MFDGVSAEFDKPNVFRDMSGRVVFRPAPTVRYTNGEVLEWMTVYSLYGKAEQRFRVGKKFTLVDGIVRAEGARAGSRTWRCHHLGFNDAFSQERAYADVASGRYGKAVVCRGATPGYDWDAMCATRLKAGKVVELKDGRRIPYRKGIDDTVPRHQLLNDLDKIPNLLDLDPRKDPDAALAWLRSLLPPALASARGSYAWSSSCCVAADRPPLPLDTPPPTLSCHLPQLLSEALTEVELRKLMVATRDHVRWRLMESGMAEDEVPARPYDPAMATSNQPIFPTAPEFEGMDDPLLSAGVARRGMLDGATEFVDVAAWRAELEVLPKLSRAYASRKPSAPATGRSAPRKKVLRPASTPVPTDDRDPRLVAARKRMAISDSRQTKAMLNGEKPSGYPAFAAQAVREICAVLALRHPGGIPEGDRHDVALHLSALLAFCCEDGDHLERRLTQLTRGLLSQEWLDSEWWGCGAQRSIHARMGSSSWDLGPAADDRLRYGRQTLIDWLEPSEEEIRLLGLVALGPQEVRAAQKEDRRRERRAAEIEARGGRQRRARGETPAWVKEGISRTEWYRRAEARKAVAEAARAAAAQREEAERLARLEAHRQEMMAKARRMEAAHEEAVAKWQVIDAAYQVERGIWWAEWQAWQRGERPDAPKKPRSVDRPWYPDELLSLSRHCERQGWDWRATPA